MARAPDGHSEAVAIDICIRIGRKVRALRSEKGLTQQMLADHAQLTREHLSELENGNKEMGVRTLERIADALDVAVQDLVG